MDLASLSATKATYLFRNRNFLILWVAQFAAIAAIYSLGLACTVFIEEQTQSSMQTSLVIFDLVKTAPMSPPYLESIHPALMGHGVIVSMLASGTVFVTVSLLTRPSEQARLALFFKEKSRVDLEPSELLKPGRELPAGN